MDPKNQIPLVSIASTPKTLMLQGIGCTMFHPEELFGITGPGDQIVVT